MAASMKPPRSVRLGPFNYEVVVMPRLRAVGDALGQCHTNDGRIYLDAEAEYEVGSETLLHEALHALWAVAGLTTGADSDEEDVVKRLSPLILDTLRRRENAPLLRYLGLT